MKSNKGITVMKFPPLPMLLGLIFLTLKLCNVITWPWIWVLCPFWIPITIVVILLILCGIVWLFSHIILLRINSK